MKLLKNLTSKAAIALAVGVALSAPATANEFEAALTELANGQIAAMISDATVIDAIIVQNMANDGLNQGDIDALDQKWRSGDSTMISGVLSNALSGYLSAQKEASGGLFSEVFVMDNKGLNVGQSDETSDYWQGDEDKWQQTYSMGPDAVHISEVEEDESTQTFQSQVSMTVVDSGDKAIGAVTVGVDVGGL